MTTAKYQPDVSSRLILIAFTATSFLLTACAQSAGWKGGDACTQIGKNREEISLLENQIAALRAKADGEGEAEEDEAREMQIQGLEDKKKDLQFSSESLQPQCTPNPNPPRNESNAQKIERELDR